MPSRALGEISVIDEHGRERERYKVPYGATITVEDGKEVSQGQVVANWDPHTHPVVTEVAGQLKFEDFVDGVTVTEQIDEFTGLTSIVILDPKTRGSTGKDLRPGRKAGRQVMVNRFASRTPTSPQTYALPAGAILSMGDGSGCLRG